MVPVPVRCQQATETQAGLLQQGRQRLQLLGQDRRVDHEALLAGTNDRAVGLPDPTREEDHVGVQGDDAHVGLPAVPSSRSGDAEQLGRLAQGRDFGGWLFLA